MYKPKILVVEDDPAITNLIRTTLDTQEYQYHTAKNGAGALLDAVSYNPDVIILDLGLPDMDGVGDYPQGARMEQRAHYYCKRTERRSGQGGCAGRWSRRLPDKAIQH